MPPLNQKPKQRDIWWVNLTPQVGSELWEPHCCLIVQIDRMNDRLPTTVVIPFVKSLLWGKMSGQPEYAILVKDTVENGLDQPRWLDISQIRCVDKGSDRLMSYKGTLEEEVFWKVERAFYATFGDLFAPAPEPKK